MVVGGFGDVYIGRLRSFLSPGGIPVAVKRLRPSGDRQKRIRVVAVSTRCVLNQTNNLRL